MERAGLPRIYSMIDKWLVGVVGVIKMSKELKKNKNSFMKD